MGERDDGKEEEEQSGMAGHQELYIIGKRNLRVCERKRSEVLWSYFHGKYKALT